MLRRLTVLSLLLAASCTRGGGEGGKAPPGGPAGADGGTAAAPAAPADGLDEYWREGAFPPGLEHGTAVPGGTITIRMNLEPGHLMYLIEPDWWLSRLILHNVNETLIRRDPHRHPTYEHIPELAEKWEESPDHLTYTFHLRKGVKWHDGKPFTSADVKFTFDRLLDPLVRASSLRQAFLDVESTSTPDPHTFVMKWKKPYVWSLEKMAEVPIYPAHAFKGHEGAKFNDAPFKRSPIGTGPYKFEKWQETHSITLARNEEYWGKKGHADKLVYRIVLEPNVAQQLLMRGEIDVDLNMNSEQYVEVAKEKRLVDNFHRLKIWESNFSWIGWNTARPHLADVNVRRALTMLFDREKIRTTIFKSVPREANCINYHLGPNCDPSAKQAAFNPGEAMKLLEGAGWKDTNADGILDKDGQPLRIAMAYPAGNPANEQVLIAYKDQLKRAGIELDLTKTEWAVFTEKLRKHEFDACNLSWVGTTEDDPYQLWHSSQTEDGSNYVNYKSPEADALILAIRAEFDGAKRAKLFQQLNGLVLRDQPYTLLYHLPRRTLISRRLKGVYDSPIESLQYRDMWIDPTWKQKE